MEKSILNSAGIIIDFLNYCDLYSHQLGIKVRRKLLLIQLYIYKITIQHLLSIFEKPKSK